MATPLETPPSWPRDCPQAADRACSAAGDLLGHQAARAVTGPRPRAVRRRAAGPRRSRPVPVGVPPRRRAARRTRRRAARRRTASGPPPGPTAPRGHGPWRTAQRAARCSYPTSRTQTASPSIACSSSARPG
ncbi:hypothetical protein AMK26_33085 [Streptomyces sp. CB03234]|nr:hypothetical protein AMK26_33085 [Streptomyces sp. CB03234]